MKRFIYSDGLSEEDGLGLSEVDAFGFSACLGLS